MKVFKSILLVSATVVWAPIAGAESVTSSLTRTSVSPFSAVSVEIKPLPTLLSALPGVGAAGVGFEGFVTEKVAIYTDVSAANSNLPHAYNDRLQARDRLYPRKMSAAGIDLGARYYGLLFSDAWYTGGKVGYSAATATWEYKDQVVKQEVSTLTPGVEAGYRWLWPSSFLVRMGLGATANIVQAQSLTSDVESSEVTEAKDELKSASRTAALAKVDL